MNKSELFFRLMVVLKQPELGKVFFQLRIESRLDWKDIEKIVGRSRQSIEKIEKGFTKDPGIWTIVGLLKAYKKSGIRNFICIDDTKKELVDFASGQNKAISMLLDLLASPDAESIARVIELLHFPLQGTEAHDWQNK